MHSEPLKQVPKSSEGLVDCFCNFIQCRLSSLYDYIASRQDIVEYFERNGFLSNLVIGPGQTCLRFQPILIVSYQRNL